MASKRKRPAARDPERDNRVVATALIAVPVLLVGFVYWMIS